MQFVAFKILNSTSVVMHCVCVAELAYSDNFFLAATLIEQQCFQFFIAIRNACGCYSFSWSRCDDISCFLYQKELNGIASAVAVAVSDNSFRWVCSRGAERCVVVVVSWAVAGRNPRVPARWISTWKNAAETSPQLTCWSPARWNALYLRILNVAQNSMKPQLAFDYIDHNLQYRLLDIALVYHAID